MLKAVSHIIVAATTLLRLSMLVYLLLFRADTHLPVTVLVVTSAVVLYGLFITFRRLAGPMRITQMTVFFSVQSAAILFNLFFTSRNVPLALDVPEIITVGTFLDILINAYMIISIIRQRRNRFLTVANP